MPYRLIASQSTVHVLSPTEVIDAIRATVVTPTHSVIAASIVAESIWGAPAGVAQLQRYAHGIDYVLNDSSALAAVGANTIDENGLLQHAVRFTVGYQPAGEITGPLTMQVDVPNALFEEAYTATGQGPGIVAALQIVATAEAALRTMAGG